MHQLHLALLRCNARKLVTKVVLGCVLYSLTTRTSFPCLMNILNYSILHSGMQNQTFDVQFFVNSNHFIVN